MGQGGGLGGVRDRVEKGAELSISRNIVKTEGMFISLGTRSHDPHLPAIFQFNS